MAWLVIWLLIWVPPAPFPIHLPVAGLVAKEAGSSLWFLFSGGGSGGCSWFLTPESPVPRGRSVLRVNQLMENLSVSPSYLSTYKSQRKIKEIKNIKHFDIFLRAAQALRWWSCISTAKCSFMPGKLKIHLYTRSCK